MIEEADICVACKGDRIVEGEKDIEVAIEKGVGDKHKFELVGAGDEYVLSIVKFNSLELILEI
jgi:DnaJ-class molecular chaperone